MADFTYPPLDPDEIPAPLSPTVPLNPPMVGEASPFDHVDGQNRDLVLESIRTWSRGPLRTWANTLHDYYATRFPAITSWLNGFVDGASDYIDVNAIPGLSWWYTDTPIAATGSTTVVITPQAPRAIQVGEFVTSPATARYGRITSVVDATHAVVLYIGPVQTYGTSVNPIRADYDPLTPRPAGFSGPAFWASYVEPVNALNGDFLFNLNDRPFTPRSLPGLHAWYDPRALAQTADGVTLASVPDVSGNQRHLLLSNGVGAPKRSTAGIPGGAIAFDGASLLRTNVFTALTGAVTVLVNMKITNSGQSGYGVAGSTSTAGDGFGIYKSATAEGSRRSLTSSASKPSGGNLLVNSDVVVFEANGTVRHYREGALLYSGTAGNDPLVRWGLGGRFGSGALGNAISAGSLIGDVAFAATSLSEADVALATAWLQSRKV